MAKLLTSLVVTGTCLPALAVAAANDNNGLPALQDEVAALTARLNALESIIEIDANGNASIKPTGDLILDAAGMTEIMDDTMVMGDTMLEGDTTMMQDAAVMGSTMLEGDTTMMEDAMIMGDAMLESSTIIEGSLVQPLSTATVALNMLTPDTPPLSSAVLVTSAAGPLEFIAPANAAGTNLRIQADDGFVVRSCSFDNNCANLGSFNIQLKENSRRYRMQPGFVLVLNWNGAVWEELARSNGIAAVASLEASFNISAMSIREETLVCDPEAGGGGILAPDGGIESSVLLNGVVEGAIDDPNLSAQTELVIIDGGPPRPGGGGLGSSQIGTVWGLRTIVENISQNATNYNVVIRCLVF